MSESAWTTEQLAGQRLMVGFDGIEFGNQLEFLITKLRVAGIILFSRNVGTPEEIAALCAAAQDCARACGQPPLLVAVDQEGGQVARLRSPFFTEFAGNPAMDGQADAEAFARITAAELLAVGLNMNLAPVMDLAPAQMDSIMAGRAFGADPQRVAELGTTVIEGLQHRGIMAVAKHFPGIGRTTLDSHLDLPVLDADPRLLKATDLCPFAAAIQAGVAGIMLSHVRYTGLDPIWPASLSPVIARDLLREKMGYDGVIMTDDLDMGAIAPHYDIDTSIGQVLEADVDLALICHWGPAIETAFDALVKKLQSDDLLRNRGRASVKRVMDLKRRYLDGLPA
ncbi:MAG: beta-N-acetylhexosaminidase [Desulfobacterales bacterium]|nr:beta-N-acetylhexosaminidase [Desulfobacterales bacterium]